MQILIIQLPPGEQLSSLSYNVEGREIQIGQDACCQIVLPDRQQQVAGRHLRIFQEGEQWYVEGLFEHEYSLNQHKISAQQKQHLLLNDGDILAIGGYRLAISDFTPWKEHQDLPLEPPRLPDSEDQAPEFCLLPSEASRSDPEQLNDPFNLYPEPDNPSKAVSPESPEINMEEHHLSFGAPPSVTGSKLIDVLAPQETLDDEWSIHRTLWSGELPDDFPSSDEGSIPVLSERVSPEKQKHRKSVCYAMLEALEQTLEDFSPENLKIKSFSPPENSGKISQLFSGKSSAPPDDFSRKYCLFHQQIMKDKNYRLLFLQRFRQAMKDQEHA